jgi:hypothetical protein
MAVLLEILLKLLRLAMAYLNRANRRIISLLQLDRPVANVFAIHFLPGFQEVLWVGKGYKAILGLLTEAVSDDFGLLERCVFVKCVGKNVVRNIVAEITNEKTEPRFTEMFQNALKEEAISSD